jgi:hypothetical protein
MITLVDGDSYYTLKARAAGRKRRGNKAMPWFSTRGQIIQTLVSAIALLLSILTFFGPNIGFQNIPPWLPQR